MQLLPAGSELLLVLGLLLACIVLFIANKPRMDVIGILVIIVLPLCGVVSVSEALAGFSDPNVVMLAALFVIGEGLARTGIAIRIGDVLIKNAGGKEKRLVALMMVAVAGLGAFMSSTGVVAIFIPVALGVCERMRIPPGRLMMPLSFAGLISGMMTLVATAPNLVVDSALRQAGFKGFDFFSFTPFGVVVLVAGVGYMMGARKWLTVDEAPKQQRRRRGFRDLIEDYSLSGRQYRLRLLPDSPLIGQTLRELEPRRRYKANVIAVERPSRFREEIVNPGAATKLEAGDIILIDIPGGASDIRPELLPLLELEALPLQGNYFTDHSRSVGMAEVSIPPGSALIGKNLAQLGFRTKYRLNVVGLRRGKRAFEGPLLREKFKQGDTLLVIGPWKAIRQLQPETRDFLVLSLPAEVDLVAPASSQAPLALLSAATMVILMVTGIVPNVMAVLITCLLMGLFRCVTMDEAYKSIHWPSIILIAGMMPFSIALQKTGGVELAVNGLLRIFGDAGPRLLLFSLFALTSTIGLFLSNTATAILMAPIALRMAKELDASPYPFAMIVALAASAAFMTPVSSPVNTLVLGPGRYKFSDFVKVGVPFTVLVMILSVLLAPWVFPIHLKDPQ